MRGISAMSASVKRSPHSQTRPSESVASICPIFSNSSAVQNSSSSLFGGVVSTRVANFT